MSPALARRSFRSRKGVGHGQETGLPRAGGHHDHVRLCDADIGRVGKNLLQRHRSTETAGSTCKMSERGSAAMRFFKCAQVTLLAFLPGDRPLVAGARKDRGLPGSSKIGRRLGIRFTVSSLARGTVHIRRRFHQNPEAFQRLRPSPSGTVENSVFRCSTLPPSSFHSVPHGRVVTKEYRLTLPYNRLPILRSGRRPGQGHSVLDFNDLPAGGRRNR